MRPWSEAKTAAASGARGAWRWPAAAAFGVLLAALCAWRLGCVQAGPDPDTDAYGHFLIARHLLETPLNFKIHWVWLPSYHALVALLVAGGASLDDVRSANAVAAALPPLLWLWALGRRERSARPLDAHLPWIAALLVAHNPLLQQLGTTGQMEVFFCVQLVLATVWLARGRYGLASVVLGALVLTRYEGWGVAASVGATLLARHVSGREPLRMGGLACILLPALCVLGWAGLRRLGGEPWFGFILDNQAFAERALAHRPSAYGLLAGLGRYTVSVPYRVFGVAALLALVGVRRALREDGVWFVAPGLAIVVFLTLSSLSRSQLGLDRHLLSVVPFAALWIAHGLARLAEALEPLITGPWPRLRGAVPSVLGAAVAFGTLARLEQSSAAWWRATESALPESREVASFLRATPASAVIVCDDAAVEVLSGLEPERFRRVRRDQHAAAHVAEWSRSRDVYVVDRARNLGAFLHAGPARFGKLEGPPDAFVAIQVRGAPREVARGG